VDVVVAGAGNGGLSAAIAAAKAGAKVVVVEISATTGGASSYSGGSIHASGIKTYDAYLKATQGLHDPVLGKVYWETFQIYKKWLMEIGASVIVSATYMPDPAVGYMGDLEMGVAPRPVTPGIRTNCRVYFDSLERIFKEAGGTLLLKTRALRILTDEAGAIVGLRTKGPAGFVNVKAKAVILACGGWQNNPELKVKYLGPDADLARVHGTPYNRGEGMLMAQEVGASLSDGFGSFQCGIHAAHPCRNPQTNPEEYEAAGYDFDGKHLFSAFSIGIPGQKVLVNYEGKRYVDETAAFPNWAVLTVRQSKATGIAIFDGPMWDAAKGVVGYHGRTSAEGFDIAAKYGAVILSANTIGELADKLAALPTPVHKANFLKTLDEYNKAVKAGTTKELEVPRTSTAVAIEKPPFWAVPTTAGIYCTYGGVAINANAQVLDMQKGIIPRLYATIPTAGGVMRTIYTGAVGCSGTFGWIAGKHAAALAKS
jgi:succinate dehydrogenase/fumarate reductase flavoprotein subunit